MAEEREQVNKKSSTVLVTGFGPFNKHKVNSSWEAARLLPTMGLRARGEEIVVVAKEIKVSYEYVKERIPALWEEIKPDLCIHVGLSPARVIKYERFASNNGYFLPDVDSRFLESSTIHPGSPDRLETPLDLTELSQQVAGIVAKGDGGVKGPGDEVKIEVSHDAGQYLCDFIYYTSLHLSKGPVLFVHVPPLDEPYSREQLAHVLKHTIETILNNHITIGGQ